MPLTGFFLSLYQVASFSNNRKYTSQQFPFFRFDNRGKQKNYSVIFNPDEIKHINKFEPETLIHSLSSYITFTPDVGFFTISVEFFSPVHQPLVFPEAWPS